MITKTKGFKLFILVSVFGLTSCGLDEQQIKPDYTLAGMQMFKNTESHLVLTTNWFDILLKMNTYIQAVDSNKLAIEDRYFPKYKIRKTSDHSWSLIQLGGDTVCNFITDANAFTSPGAVWKIKVSGMASPCTFTCVNSTKWALNVINFKINTPYYNPDFYSYNYSSATTSYLSDSLNFESESSNPKDFVATNFQVSGKGEYLLSNSEQKVKISFNIEKNLKHLANSVFNMSSGKYSLSAEDLETAEKGNASAEFETIIGDNKRVTIVYNGRTQTYPNNNTQYVFTPL